MYGDPGVNGYINNIKTVLKLLQRFINNWRLLILYRWILVVFLLQFSTDRKFARNVCVTSWKCERMPYYKRGGKKK